MPHAVSAQQEPRLSADLVLTAILYLSKDHAKTRLEFAKVCAEGLCTSDWHQTEHISCLSLGGGAHIQHVAAQPSLFVEMLTNA